MSALVMAVKYTQKKQCEFHQRGYRGCNITASQKSLDDVTIEVEDAARLELACVEAWVIERDTPSNRPIPSI